MRAFAIQLLFGTAEAAVHVVGKWPGQLWTHNAGFCKTIPGQPEGMHMPDGLDRIYAVVGDSVTFTFATDQNLWHHSSLESLESCDYAEATQYADSTEGGGCADEADLSCMEAATPFEYAANTPGDHFFSSRVGTHCEDGVRLLWRRSRP